MERCFRLFLAGLSDSKATRDGYTDRMRYFKEWAKFEKYSDLLKMDPKKLQALIEDYIFYRIDNNHPNSIGGYYYPIQTFLEMNDVLLNFKKLKRLLPSHVKTAIERGWNETEIRDMLSVSKNLIQRAVIHFENASGGRTGVFNDLKMKHLILLVDDKEVTFEDWLKDISLDLTNACTAIIGYADEKEEYVTFLTPEATGAFFKYVKKRIADGEKVSTESPAFRKVYRLGGQPVIPATSKSLQSIVYHVQQKAGLRDPRTKKGTRYAVPTNHGFRHRFDEIIKSVPGINAHSSEKIFAHTSRLIPMDSTYNNPTIQKLFVEYKKIIPYIMIDETERQKMELHKKEEINQELRKKNDDIEELKRQQKQDKAELLEMFSDKLEQMRKEGYIPK